MNLFPPSPIHLEPRQCGRFAIEHKEITECDLVSAREMVLTGKRAHRLRFNTPLTIHQLIEEGRGCWMSDLPIELRQLKENIDTHQWKGSVLVGGLGLGIAAKWLSNIRGVRVTCVEKEQDVIDLTANDSYGTICDDITKYIQSMQEWPYDGAYLDTWAGTNESEWWDTVFPLRRLIANKFGKQKIVCWAEDQMLGQVLKQLLNCTRPHWFYKEVPMTPAKAKRFLREVGLPKWECEFGHIYPKQNL